MQDNNPPTNFNSNASDTSSVPTHVDDYQPPQPASPPAFQSSSSSNDDHNLGDKNQPFNVPAAPPVMQDSDKDESDKDEANVNVSDDYQPLASNEPIEKMENKKEDKKEKDREAQVSDKIKEDASPKINSPVNRGQSLEVQNIFDLLGVSDGKEEEKEAFLDELQEVIWEDFIENDTELLLNQEQQTKLKEIQAKGKTPQVQEEMLVYLEKILPDLEDLMMDKALELKEDMVLERISGMKEFYSNNQEALNKIKQAEELISQNKWADSGKLLNEIK